MTKKSISNSISIQPASIEIPDEYKALLRCIDSINICFDNHLESLIPDSTSIDLRREQSISFSKFLSSMPIELAT
ncbi:MAG: hypothetical protein COA79_22710 [Planctomycetota bacterium]|nr:hypothetical protein [Bacteroidia bacterium]PCJ53577.1 MAG: hypothetical protein COA79_22710 [Planctomycetota bacterium]